MTVKTVAVPFSRLRYYSPSHSRFLSEDPLEFDAGDPNLYAYVFNNPTNFIDPTGEIKIPGPIKRCLLGMLKAAGIDLAKRKSATDPDTLVDAAQGCGGGGSKAATPPISPQKQAGHVPGTSQYNNRVKQGKPTSAFFGQQSGQQLTQQAWAKGQVVDPKRPNVREHDFGFSVGTGPDGGMQTRVRVHQDSQGRIHGHPSGPQRY